MTTGPKKGRSSKSSPGYVVQSPNAASNNVGKDDTPPTDNSTYPLHQQKGQRRYGPPSDWVEELPRGSEVHVSKLPRDLLEDELIPVFEKVGRIFDIRLMMETPEFNKGYAFVKFCCKEDSEAAIIQLNEYEIRPGVHIVVRRSVDNNRLFIGNIPKNYLADDVLKAMREVTTGVVKVILYASVNDRTKNRGYGFVEFETHQQAKNTRNKLKLIPLVWSGQEIKVDWAEPELEVDEETMKKVCIRQLGRLKCLEVSGLSKNRKTVKNTSINFRCNTPTRGNIQKYERKVASPIEMKSTNNKNHVTTVSMANISMENHCNLNVSSLEKQNDSLDTFAQKINNNSEKNATSLPQNSLEKSQKLDNSIITKTKWIRKYAPLECSNIAPPKGSEIFVGRIPRDLFEDELIPVLQKAGTLYEVRLMMESSGLLNRGFAYVKYKTKEEADIAVKILNNYEIRDHQFLGVMKSVDNNRLFVGGIPKNKKQDDLLEEMRRLTEDVIDVILYADITDKTKNRGFAFVEYISHTSAYAARQKLLKNPPLLWGTTTVKVDWAEPEREVDEETMKKVRILYVRNLALTTTDQQLRQLFSSFVLDKCEIDINWSKPVVNREEYQQRKAASKALSSGPNIPNAIQATFGLNGMRTAAGAQGYNASRPYPLRTKQSEETFSALQPPVIYPNFAYYQDISIRNTIDSYGLASPVPPTLYATERVSQMEEFVAPHQEVQYHIAQPQLVQRVPNMFTTAPYNVVNTPGLANCWPPQAILQPTNASPAFISTSPFVVPTPTIPSVPGAYTTQPFYGGQLMTQNIIII
ncbi:putative RNA-binding protein 46 [Armadillidium vulgare]|nr:putative RNA-binding protein 46 [Armadillidium vulgare]